MAWQDFARAVASAWARPRSGGFAPSETLAYMAGMSFWQATNMEGFVGDADAWTEAVQKALTEAPEGATRSRGKSSREKKEPQSG